MVLHGAVRAAGRSALRLFTNRNYQRVTAWSLLHLLGPRHRPGRVVIAGRPVTFPDWASFLSAYEEIFADEIYAFDGPPDPYIIDIGANVGLGVLYLKTRYPGARVLAFEPDPTIFSYLRHNVESHALRDVELRNQAVWTDSTTLEFAPDGADGGRLTAGGAVRVEAVAIHELLDRPVDFLKMDIEGAENAVLPACAGRLDRVRNIFVEYHSPAAQPQQLSRIVEVLDGAGFRLALDTIRCAPSPLRGAPPSGDFDLQVNIFGFRP